MGICKSPVPLYGVMNGRMILYKKRYWACRKEEWNGFPDIRGKVNKKNPFNTYKLSIIKPDGTIDYTENISNYSRDNNLDASSMYKLAKGYKDNYKGYRIERFK